MRMPSLHIQKDGLHSIIHRIKTAELAHCLHTNYAERVRNNHALHDTYRPHTISHLMNMQMLCFLFSTCTRIHPHTHTHAHTHTHTHTHMHTCTHAHTHTNTHTYTHARAHKHTGLFFQWKPGKALCSEPTATGEHQAAACQCVCEFFYLVLSSYGSRIDFIEPTYYSKNRPLSN